jgi:hypothetical protein
MPPVEQAMTAAACGRFTLSKPNAASTLFAFPAKRRGSRE